MPGNNSYILLADDDKDDRILFKEALREVRPGIQLITADHGSALMEFLKNAMALPGIIFLDINMPYKNGIDCLIEIRSNKIFSGIPIVIYSTSSNPKDVDETCKAGANLYIEKPNSFTHLTGMLSMLLDFDWSQYPPYAGEDHFFWKMHE